MEREANSSGVSVKWDVQDFWTCTKIVNDWVRISKLFFQKLVYSFFICTFCFFILFSLTVILIFEACNAH